MRGAGWARRGRQRAQETKQKAAISGSRSSGEVVMQREEGDGRERNRASVSDADGGNGRRPGGLGKAPDARSARRTRDALDLGDEVLDGGGGDAAGLALVATEEKLNHD